MPNLRHAFVSAKTDSADATIVRPTNWNAQLQYTDGTGAPSGTNALVREVLLANRTYYVRTDGSDSNDGLTNTAAGAFLTYTHALSVIIGSLDIAGFTVTVSIQNTTWTDQITFNSSPVGGGILVFDFNSGSLSTAATSVRNSITLSCYIIVKNVTISSSAGIGVDWEAPFGVELQNVNWGVCALGHMQDVGPGSFIFYSTGVETITGNSPSHIRSTGQGVIFYYPTSTTLSGTPVFSTAFTVATTGSYIESAGVVFTGATTGVRFSVDSNATIFTSAGGANYYPGNAAGTMANGGIYV